MHASLTNFSHYENSIFNLKRFELHENSKRFYCNAIQCRHTFLKSKIRNLFRQINVLLGECITQNYLHISNFKLLNSSVTKNKFELQIVLFMRKYKQASSARMLLHGCLHAFVPAACMPFSKSKCVFQITPYSIFSCKTVR